MKTILLLAVFSVGAMAQCFKIQDKMAELEYTKPVQEVCLDSFEAKLNYFDKSYIRISYSVDGFDAKTTARLRGENMGNYYNVNFSVPLRFYVERGRCGEIEEVYMFVKAKLSNDHKVQEISKANITIKKDQEPCEHDSTEYRTIEL